MMPLTNSIEVDDASLNEKILLNKNVGDVVDPGVASEASEFEFIQNED